MYYLYNYTSPKGVLTDKSLPSTSGAIGKLDAVVEAMKECVAPGSINTLTSKSNKEILPLITSGATSASWRVKAYTLACLPDDCP